MAIYHLTAKMISRSSGKCLAAAASYRAGTTLRCNRTGLAFDYRRKRGVVFETVMAPKMAPAWMRDRQLLVDAVEQANKRKDSQLMREIEFALPIELSRKAQIRLAEKFIYAQCVKLGMVADLAIHDTGKGNPHCHVLLTLNAIEGSGFGKKCRAWNDVAWLEEAREQWARHCNRTLSLYGIDARIDHRTLEAQGENREPCKRLSRQAFEAAKRGRVPSKNNNKEANMPGPCELARAPKLESIPTFVQPDRERMQQLHFHEVRSEQSETVPRFTAEPYRFWLADVFQVPTEQVVWVRTPPATAYRIKVGEGSILDHGDMIRCEKSTAVEIEAVIKLAAAKGWKCLRLSGNREFRQQAFMMAVANGYEAKQLEGYDPSKTDMELALQMRAKLAEMRQAIKDAENATRQDTGQGDAKADLTPKTRGGFKP